jgi:hypothetical protein
MAEHRARITWSDEQVRRGLPTIHETVDPAWPDGTGPAATIGWSLRCRFEVAPAEQGNPSIAWVDFMLAEAPHSALQVGTRWQLFERGTRGLATVEIVP